MLNNLCPPLKSNKYCNYNYQQKKCSHPPNEHGFCKTSLLITHHITAAMQYSNAGSSNINVDKLQQMNDCMYITSLLSTVFF